MQLLVNRYVAKGPVWVLQAPELLDQIQEQSRVKLNGATTWQHPGRYLLDDRIHGYKGQGTDWILAPLEKDPSFQQGTLWMPQARLRRKQFLQLDELIALAPNPRNLKVSFYIAHELGERGHIEEIERSQRIPIELITPISRRQYIGQFVMNRWHRLLKWSKSVWPAVNESVKYLAAALTIIGGVWVIVAILAALAQMIVSLLAVGLVGAVVVGGLAAGGAGLDPVILMAIEDEDGFSTVYELLAYSYPVAHGPV